MRSWRAHRQCRTCCLHLAGAWERAGTRSLVRSSCRVLREPASSTEQKREHCQQPASLTARRMDIHAMRRSNAARTNSRQRQKQPLAFQGVAISMQPYRAVPYSHVSQDNKSIFLGGQKVTVPNRRVCHLRTQPAVRMPTTCSSAGRNSRTEVKIGSVVAVERGRGRVGLARVTGVSSNGSTVDIVLLKEYVKEMYVDDVDAASTYERIEDVRAIAAEYAPTQEGWIVLDQDIAVARRDFEQRYEDAERLRADKEPTVVITAADKKQLSEKALKRQRGFGFPKPTRTQALFGAAISAPLAAILYAGFVNAKQAYATSALSPDDTAAGFRQAILFGYGAGCVASLVVGSALLLFALTGASSESGESS